MSREQRPIRFLWQRAQNRHRGLFKESQQRDAWRAPTHHTRDMEVVANVEANGGTVEWMAVVPSMNA